MMKISGIIILKNKKGNFNKEIKGTLFNFDPNTLETAGWKKLGVRDRTITTIQNYLVKGGRFYQPADIAKIWGLREDEIQRLLPFVSIPPKHTAAKSEEKNGVYQPYIKKENKIIPFDINIADTTAFIALPGIGSKLAARIISYREKLGGFYRIEQVAETFALPDSTYRQIKKYLVVNQPSIKKININSATIDEMKIHPYIRYSLAAAIYQYRTQHGNFVSPSDIKKIMMVTEEDYNRLAAYIIVQ